MLSPYFGESLRGNRIGATGLRASERKSGFSEIFERFLEVFRGFQRFSEIFERFSEIFERFSEVLSEADFLSEALSPVTPNRVALELSPSIGFLCKQQEIYQE